MTGLATLALVCLVAGVDPATTFHVQVIDLGAGSSAVVELEQELATYGFPVRGDGTGSPDVVITVHSRGTRLALPNGAQPIEFTLDFVTATRLQRRRHFITIIERMRSIPSGSSPGIREAASASAVTSKESVGETDAGAPRLTASIANTTAVPPNGLRARELGLATTASYMGDDTGVSTHAALLGQWFTSRHTAVFGRILWPLQDTTRQTAEQNTRLWTFGFDFGGSLLPVSTDPVLSPFVGFGLGPRLLVTEATRTSVWSQDVSTLFGWSASLALGLRLRFWQHTALFAQAELAYAGTFSQRGRALERVHALAGPGVVTSLGLLFDR